MAAGRGSGTGSSPDLRRDGGLALHVVGQLPDVLAFGVAEIEARLGELGRVAVGPEGEERVARVERAPGVVVVEGAVAGDLVREGPRLPLILAGPEAHLAAAAVGPGAGQGGGDDR